LLISTLDNKSDEMYTQSNISDWQRVFMLQLSPFKTVCCHTVLSSAYNIRLHFGEDRVDCNTNASC